MFRDDCGAHRGQSLHLLGGCFEPECFLMRAIALGNNNGDCLLCIQAGVFICNTDDDVVIVIPCEILGLSVVWGCFE